MRGQISNFYIQYQVPVLQILIWSCMLYVVQDERLVPSNVSEVQDLCCFCLTGNMLTVVADSNTAHSRING